jgi:hypothetical protein
VFQSFDELVFRLEGDSAGVVELVAQALQFSAVPLEEMPGQCEWGLRHIEAASVGTFSAMRRIESATHCPAGGASKVGEFLTASATAHEIFRSKDSESSETIAEIRSDSAGVKGDVLRLDAKFFTAKLNLYRELFEIPSVACPGVKHSIVVSGNNTGVISLISESDIDSKPHGTGSGMESLSRKGEPRGGKQG